MRTRYRQALTLALVTLTPAAAGAQARAPRALKERHAAALTEYAEPAWFQRAAPLTAGAPRTGALAAAGRTFEDGTRYQLFRYRARRGERVAVQLRSTAFDASLAVVRFAPTREVEVLAENDDWEGGTNARAVLRAPSTEDILIVVSAVTPPPTGVGAFVLELSAEPPIDWASVFPGGGAPRGRYALLVGISKYPGTGNDLWGPREDAERMARLLVERYGYQPDDVLVLTDADATREQIAEAFLRHLGQAGPEGTALFYFSGHGFPMLGNEGIGEPLDPEPDGRDEAIAVWDATGVGTYLLDDELGGLIQRLRTRRTLIILDACYSGDGTRAPTFQPKGLGSREGALRYHGPKLLGAAPLLDSLAPQRGDEAAPENHLLLAAARSDQVAYADSLLPDGAGKGSLFTWVLEQALREAGSDTPLERLMASVTARTVSLSDSRYQTTQTPQLEGTRKGLPLREFLGDTVSSAGIPKGTVPYRRPKKRP
jgi:hypothetical protein